MALNQTVGPFAHPFTRTNQCNAMQCCILLDLTRATLMSFNTCTYSVLYGSYEVKMIWGAADACLNSSKQNTAWSMPLMLPTSSTTNPRP